VALLAQLAVAQPYGVSRDKLIAYFWPEAETDRARHLLSASVYVLRQALGDAAIVTAGDDLALNPEVVRSDVRAFDAALDAGDLESAVSHYRGPFLDGFFLQDAGEFERWAEAERVRLAQRHAAALERLARDAMAGGDTIGAVSWWRSLTATEPLNSRAALALMEALVAAGDSAGALQYARAHERIVEEELGSALDPNIAAFRDHLRNQAARRHLGSEPTVPSDPRAAPAADPAPAPSPERSSVTPAAAMPVRDLPPARATGVDARRASRPAPPRRWRSLVGGGVAALLMLLILAMLDGRERRPAAAPLVFDPKRVDVVGFANMTGDSTLDRLGQIAADWISQGLARTRLVNVTPVGLDSWAGDPVPPAGERLTQLAGARVVGAFYRQDDSLRFQARLVDWTGQQIGAMDAVTTHASAPLEGIERTRQQVMALLSSHVEPNMNAWATAARQPTTFEAYNEFAAGMEAFVSYDMHGAHEHFTAAAAADSSYLLPVLWAVFSSGNAGRYAVADSLLRSLVPGRERMTPFEAALLDYHLASRTWNHEAAYRATKRMVDIAPGSEWHYLFALSAIRAHRPHEAVEYLLRVDPNRGWLRGEFGVNYWALLSGALHWLNEYEWQLETVRHGLTRYPGALNLKAAEVAALTALGRLEEADSAAATAVAWSRSGVARLATLRNVYTELEAHGHREAALRHARAAVAAYAAMPESDRQSPGVRLYYVPALNAAGDSDSARAVAERLSAEFPDEPTYRTQLGMVAALGGDRGRAIEVLGSLHGDDPATRYRRGIILAALGEHERAVSEVRDIVLGMVVPDSVWTSPHPGSIRPSFTTMHIHPGLRSLWSYAPFVELMKPKDAPAVLENRPR
jgi:DNA-binding SARP family transcriptional activator/tetratricopeptide (TPR) repeat protein